MRSAHFVPEVSSATIRAVNHAPYVDRFRQSNRGSKNSMLRSERLSSLASEMGKTYARVLTRVDCDASCGDELLSQLDIFSAEPRGRIIRGDLMPFCEDLRIRRGDILIPGAGQIGNATLFGRAVIADDRLAGKLAAGDIMVVRFDEPDADLSVYVYGFLLSRFGLEAIRACAYGTSIPRMRPDLLAQLPIPIPDKLNLARVASLLRDSMCQREAFLAETRKARRVLEELPEMRAAHDMCSERRARCVVWNGELPTLAGWTYASAGEALAHLRRRWHVRVGDVLRPGGLYYGLLRQRTPCSPGYGIPLVSQPDVLSIRPIAEWIANPRVARHAVFSLPHSLVMAGRGGVGEGHTFGQPAYITPRLSRYALTQDLLRVVPHEEHAATLYAYLSTTVGKRLLRSAAVGTVIMQFRLDLIRALPFPELPTKEQSAAIRRHHSRAVAAYDQAQEAESEAIRIIEEEVLPKWLA